MWFLYFLIGWIQDEFVYAVDNGSFASGQQRLVIVENNVRSAPYKVVLQGIFSWLPTNAWETSVGFVYDMTKLVFTMYGVAIPAAVGAAQPYIDQFDVIDDMLDDPEG